ncbi:MAG: molybdate ABC transporter substrate-binding protein [Deltaproteobacteria bacterium]|jgi:molybdenum ABC transporter molybdate-binding protein|nr:molybdate ABC transporter substrate-binding protein [Deltaproteobacteria bacterium]
MIKITLRNSIVFLAILLVGSWAIWSKITAQSTQVQLAVAANFQKPIYDLVNLYNEQYPGALNLTVNIGATGNFLKEIETAGVGNSPYDLFLAANTAAPIELKTGGYAPVADNVTNYANGQLALYANDPGGLIVGPDTTTAVNLLTAHTFAGQLVVADTVNAPYGAAAKEVLSDPAINVDRQYVLPNGDMNTANVDVEPDIGAAYSKVASGGASFPAGFIALSEICGSAPSTKSWIVDQSYYDPLTQAAIVLSSRHGAASTAGAEAFLSWLMTDPDAQNIIITDYCYSIPSNSKNKK